TEDLSLAGDTIQQEHPQAKDEDEITDMSMEMECDGAIKTDEEKKGEDTAGEDGQPVIEQELNEKAKGGDMGGVEEEREERCRKTNATVKQRKSHRECRDCGKKFTRRETYNLHRHFHMHQDEQASLTCRECGLTFQHRSSLIKHRSEHKLNGMPPSLPAPQRRSKQREMKEERGLYCEHCGERFASLVRYRLHACQQNLEKPYRCPLCRREFQYRVSINAHMQSHSLESPYRCLECNKGFQCAVTLHIHQRSHAALKPYECPDCGMVFRHRSFMEDHRRRHTEETPHQCNICGKSFKHGSLLQQHRYLHTGQKPYRCSDCGKRFAFAQNMRAHCRQHKRNSGSTSPEAHIPNYDVPNGTSLETVGKENTNHDIKQQRNCPLCPQLFYKAADLRMHMLIHEAEYEKLSNGKKHDQVYACAYCPLKFLDESTLQSHAFTHEVIPAPLKREVLSVARASSIDNMSGGGDWGDHAEKKPLKCRECGKSFHYRSVLELHMRIHNKGYQCHVCKKSFRFSSYLQQHLIIHSGKKPYKCPDCGKDFAFLQNMKTHQRLHQQKPFRCTQCRKGYSDEVQLQRHMLSHSGDKPHKCHLCDKSFGLAYLLRDHLNTHTGERPHRCQECHKSFPWLSSLLVHQKIHARKRQGLSQSYSPFVLSQRGRTRGMGSRSRRSSKWISSWSRTGGDTGWLQDPFPGQILQGLPLPNLIGQQSSDFDSDVHEQTQPSSQQSLQPWRTENPSRPIQLQQQWQVQIKPQLQRQHQPKWISERQASDDMQLWNAGVHLKPILPKLEGMPNLPHQQSPGWANEPLSAQNEQKSKPQNSLNQLLNIQGQLSHWPVFSDITQNTKTEPLGPTEKDNTIAFRLKTPVGTMQAKNESDKLINNRDEPPKGQQSTILASQISISTQTGKINDTMESNISSLLHENKPWNFRAKEISKTLNLQEKPVNETGTQQPQLHIMQHPSQQQQQMQLLPQQQPNQMSPAWVSAPQANQIGPVSVQFGAARFIHRNRSTVWGFQTTPVVSQTLLNGPIQQGPVVAQQQVPVVSGPQILLSQTSPFITPPLALPPSLALPGPHPIHSVAGQLSGSAPQSVFFTPQGIMSERSVLQQALSSSHLAQRTEPHKLSSQVPFSPDRRFRCMVCGCTLHGELELQMHYMQHAQGEI
uniref:C2H2-type domain-containing protein n=1 Tax=Electrophorus electricus TaxID=8005 RepID=A0AAY5EX58_ELEEL